MATEKFSALPAASSLGGSDILPIVQGGVNKSTTVTLLGTTIGGGGTLAGLSDVNVTEGSGIDGYSLTWDNGTSKWIATNVSGGGGGFSGKLMYPIDTPPGSPTTWDDEFPGSSLNGRWTATNWRTGTTPVYTVGNGFLNVQNNSIGGGRTLSGITQALPGSGTWEYTTCIVSNTAPYENYSLPTSLAITAGLGSTDLVLQYGVVYANASTVTQLGLNNCTWSSYTGSDGYAAYLFSRHYLKVAWNGTNLSWSFSSDGISFVQTYSGAPGFTPAYVGLLADAEANTFTVNGTYAWFRKTA